MKKKILLIIMMFMFITNVNALTFNVDVTNIEDKGSDSLGTIEKIDITNKELDILFQEPGDEVNFSITITNRGDRAGTLRSIDVTSSNDKIEYTSNLPENGLAINGNGTNEITVKAKAKDGIVNGKTTSEIKIKYTYDEGSCPEGEILSEDESMCLCPEGKVRNDSGICIDPPEDKPSCEENEIYNETKKICEKKVVPVNPSNPKTLDNIILITLLFFVSGLGIYAVIFKKLDTNKKKVTGGVITGVITLSLSFTVLAGVFGLDNLLGAIINPITKNKEIIVKVNEEIDLIETWDGDCDITGALTPDNIFQGGSGTESDPYKIKTANQLACFAKSINEGTTYEGKYIKQIKNIKLNDNLNDQAEAGDLSNANAWTPAGYPVIASPYSTSSSIPTLYFAGTYDGGNHKISGLFIDNESGPTSGETYYYGLFGAAVNATFKNLELADVYMESSVLTASLLGYGYKNLSVENIKTYGNGNFSSGQNAGVISIFIGNNEGGITLKNVENNINLTFGGSQTGGIISYIEKVPESDEPNIIFDNVTNNGNISGNNLTYSGGIAGYIAGQGNILFNKSSNTGIANAGDYCQHYAGLAGDASGSKITITESFNTGDLHLNSDGQISYLGGLLGNSRSSSNTIIDNSYNSGNFTLEVLNDEAIEGGYPSARINAGYTGGLVGSDSGEVSITNSFNTGNLKLSMTYVGGIIGQAESGLIEDSYNLGNITNSSYMAGILVHGPLVIINKTYNKGDLLQYATNQIGGIASEAKEIYNSYNEGNIRITAITDGGGYAGGICGLGCSKIENCYNRGNITSTNRNSVNISGISGHSEGTIKNSYNSGNLTFEDGSRSDTYIYFSGISTNSDTINTYNLGNVYINENRGGRQIWGSGITLYGNAVNSVNKGNVTTNFVTDAYLDSHQVNLSGIAFSRATNCFNSGTVSIKHNDETYSRDFINSKSNFKVGEITVSLNEVSSNNKFNTDSNSVALGCYPNDTCSLEASQAVGTYTTEEAPDILSIINGDDAFEIKDGETLPTLKAFNE